MKYLRIYIKTFVVLALVNLGYLSCKKSDTPSGSGSIVVDRVSIQSANTIDSTITKAHLGTLIRIDGSGFSDLKAVYVNGVVMPINPGYVSDRHIIFPIPSDLPYGNDVSDTSARNTIRLVTASGSYSFPFVIQGAIPVITGVSNTLPAEGDSLYIFGTGLRDITKLVFPGGVELSTSQFSTNDSTIITCVVPAGGTDSAGAIMIYSENGAAASTANINFKKGVFINDFTNDHAAAADGATCSVRPYNYGSNIAGTSSALLPSTGGWTKNPAFYRAVPATPDAGMAVDFSGGFYFQSCASLFAAMSSAPENITPTTSCSSLALQFDYYMSGEWSSGFIRFEWINGNATWRYDYAPWAMGAGVVQPVNMRGWRTVTIPLNSFPGLNGTVPFETFIADMTGQGGKMLFMNSTYTDAGGNSYPAATKSNFVFSFGNFRIVPNYKPTVPAE